MMGYVAITLTNVGICGAIAYAVHHTGSAWPLLALVFLFSWRHKSGKCPKCGEHVIFTKGDTDE